MLVLIKIDLLTKKQNCKLDIVKTSGISSSKIIFILFTEVVAFHIRFFIIDIRDFNL